MKTKTLLIGLLTDRIDVLLCSGAQCVDGRRISVPLEQDPLKWPRQVREAAKALGDAAASLGARGAKARVLYRGPTALAEYTTPRVRSEREAASAAILACADSLNCPIDAACCEAMVVASERGDPGKSHVIVAADGDDALAAISDMVTEAGLKFTSATPLDAALMAIVAQRLTEQGTGCRAALYLGEHRSFLAVVAEGTLLFARSISVGLDTLVTSLCTPFRLRDGRTLQFSADKARSIIHECGIPDRAQVIDEAQQVTGGQIIPLLQPALQRCMVEVRQSLRFALPDGQRQKVRLTLWGPGARTPGLLNIAADELGLQVECDERSRSYDALEPASAASELSDALAERRVLAAMELRPLAATRRVRQGAMRRWLWTGAAAALAMIAFDAVRFQTRLKTVRHQAQLLQAESDSAKALQATAERLVAASTAMQNLENTIRRETGAQVCMGAALKELSRLTPPSIRLANITFKPGSDVINGIIVGYALDDASTPGSATRTLESYMQRLSQSPLLFQLVLSNVQVTNINDVQAQSFEVAFNAVAAPVSVAQAADALNQPAAQVSADAATAHSGATP